MAFENYFPFANNSLEIYFKMLANYGYYIVNIDYYYSDSVKKKLLCHKMYLYSYI